MNTLNDQLMKWRHKNQQVPEKKEKKAAITSQKASHEKLTDRDIKDLMGMNRPRYEKRRGSIRQR
jgi:hypothetical protein